MTFTLSTILNQLYRPILIASASLITLGGATAFVIVDCHIRQGQESTRPICNSIIGGAASTQLTLEHGVTLSGPFFGDGVAGRGGNDTLINYGTTVSIANVTGLNGDMEGDVAGGNGGNDVLVNYGTVASDMDGDTAIANGDNDVIFNAGTVGDDLDGDNARLSGGDDFIINNGTVGGDIQADDNDEMPDTTGGRDLVVVNGLVEGYIDTDAGVAQGGNDHVILQSGADGGSDHELYINGNGGEDTLVFNFTDLDTSTYQTLNDQLAKADPNLGTITLNGQRYEWENFEHLENQNQLKGAVSPITLSENGKLYAQIDAHQAALYCVGGRVTAIGLTSQSTPEWLFTLNAADLKAALTQATNAGISVSIAQADGQQLSALGTGELTLTDAAGRFALTSVGSFCAP